MMHACIEPTRDGVLSNTIDVKRVMMLFLSEFPALAAHD
jgi:hypothetical protein